MSSSNTLMGVLGQWEMELAAMKIIANGIDQPFTLDLFRGDDELETGFVELIYNEWLDRAMYNGQFVAGNNLRERIASHGVPLTAPPRATFAG